MSEKPAKKKTGWSAKLKAARGERTATEAARAITAFAQRFEPAAFLSERTVEEWESGRSEPASYVQGLILAALGGKSGGDSQ